VREIENAVARFAVGREEESADIERLPLQPVLEGWRGDEIVECHREGEAVFFGVELRDREDAQLLKRRGLHLHDQRLEVEVLPLAPSVLENV